MNIEKQFCVYFIMEIILYFAISDAERVASRAQRLLQLRFYAN